MEKLSHRFIDFNRAVTFLGCDKPFHVVALFKFIKLSL